MPRRARRCIESEYLHVIVQGINREFIFNNHHDIKKYYSLMISKAEKYDVAILAYCIMNNHAHMLLFSDKIQNISEFMKSLNISYAQYYNKTHARVGYVFRDRFYSEMINNERQLYNCISYIHFNPVEAKMTDSPGKYRYSSYNDFINKNGIVNDHMLKLIFGASGDYLPMFHFIHYGIEDAMDVVDKDDVIDKMLDENKLRGKCLTLKKEKLSNRKIAAILGINRNKVDRMMKSL